MISLFVISDTIYSHAFGLMIANIIHISCVRVIYFTIPRTCPSIPCGNKRMTNPFCLCIDFNNTLTSCHKLFFVILFVILLKEDAFTHWKNLVYLL